MLGLLVAGYDRDPPKFGDELEVSVPDLARLMKLVGAPCGLVKARVSSRLDSLVLDRAIAFA